MCSGSVGIVLSVGHVTRLKIGVSMFVSSMHILYEKN